MSRENCDRTILLEVYSPKAEAVREAIAPLPKTSSTAYYRRGDGSKLSIRLLVLRVILLISACWSSERF